MKKKMTPPAKQKKKGKKTAIDPTNENKFFWCNIFEEKNFFFGFMLWTSSKRQSEKNRKSYTCTSPPAL